MALIVTLSFASTLYNFSLMPSLDSDHVRHGSESGYWAKVKLLVKHDRLVERIGFGSGMGVTSGPQPIWSRGIIPSAPDVWIWSDNIFVTPRFPTPVQEFRF